MTHRLEKSKIAYKCIVAFALPLACLLMIYALWGQYPFGDKTLLIWDMNWQYANFFSYLHEFLHGKADMLYSLSVAIGGDMYSIAAYYLLSPFNLIFYFFDAEHIYIGIFFLTLLKVGTIGLCMNFYLEKHSSKLGSLIFSTIYALSGYIISYSFNIMWLDVIAILPIMVIALEKLCDQENYWLYPIVLGMGIITNFFFGYMLCLFSVMYFIVYTFFLTNRTPNLKRTIPIYCLDSLLGGGISAVVVVPVYLAMSNGKGGSRLGILKDFSRLINLREVLFLKFGSTVATQPVFDGRSTLFCTLLVPILVILYFVFYKTRTREKIGYGIMIVFFIFSMYLRNVNSLWCGLYLPGGCPNRFLFIFVFALLVIAYRMYVSLDSALPNRGNIILILIGIAFCLEIIATPKDQFGISKPIALFINIGFCAIYVCVIIFLKHQKRVMTLLLLGAITIELIVNGTLEYKNCDQYSSTNVDMQESYVKRVNKVLHQTVDDDVSRIAITKNIMNTKNDSFLFNINGMTSYTSMENSITHTMASRLGYENNILYGINYGAGSTKAADSILGVKYNLDSLDGTNIMLSENDTVLPMAFLAGCEILNIDSDTSLFNQQERFYSSLVTTNGIENSIFEEVSIADELSNSEITIGEEDGKRIKYIDYVINIDKNRNMYLIYNQEVISKITLVQDDNEKNISEINGKVKKVGEVKEGDIIDLRLEVATNAEITDRDVQLVYENNKILTHYQQEVLKQNVEIVKKSDSEWTIGCTNTSNEDQYLVWTIPNTKGWRVTIDGKPTDVLETMGAMITIKVSPGAHILKMMYTPPGIIIGMLVSVLSFIAVLINVLVLRHTNYLENRRDWDWF